MNIWCISVLWVTFLIGLLSATSFRDLQRAIENGSSDQVEFILNENADLINFDAREEGKDNGYTQPLFIALKALYEGKHQGSDEKIIALLIQKGANVNQLSMWQHSPLYDLCDTYNENNDQGRIERVARMLIEAGADGNFQHPLFKDTTVISACVRKKFIGVIRILKEHNVTIDLNHYSAEEQKVIFSASRVERVPPVLNAAYSFKTLCIAGISACAIAGFIRYAYLYYKKKEQYESCKENKK